MSTSFDVPPPSWEVFGICDTCGTDKGKPCYNLKTSTPKNLIEAALPHRGRPRIDPNSLGN